MNPQEQQLRYPHGELVPAPGCVIDVAPGVKWLRMGLPFALNHINLWLLRDRISDVEGWSIVDTGIYAEASKAHWETIFATALDGLPVLRVIATHMHPDHIGLADWLCTRWGIPLYISGTDFLVAHMACAGEDTQSGARAAQFFASHGLHDAQTQRQLLERKSYFSTLVPRIPAQFERLIDGLVLPIGDSQWRCISGYGHAPEHMALYSEQHRVLIAGDMLLPRISTNVSVNYLEPNANALQRFLDSIDRFLPLPADTLVLPSHGKPFWGMHTRVQQLHAHHTERLDALLALCRDRACSAADALPVLFPRALDFHQTTFALGEAVAHLHALWAGGRVRRHQDADAVYRFTACT